MGLEAMAYVLQYLLYKVNVTWCQEKMKTNNMEKQKTNKRTTAQIVLSHICYPW